ncbi:MAG: hypothetical protein U9O89_04825 [Thermoproteota archaeon]|nr:hypothetical protein [Thermoproteota archaeon]
MKAKIAVATVSGKAYYLLVNELKKNGRPFLSLTPQKQIPPDVKVVITTEKERHLITHPDIVVYKNGADPTAVVEKAIRIAEGKHHFDKMVVGIDPGKTFGIAILGDGFVVKTLTRSNPISTVNAMLETLNRTPVTDIAVKIGDGAPLYTKELLRLLDKTLPKSVQIELVSEAGTSHLTGEAKHRRELTDIESAIKIAGRKGRPLKRGKLV